MANPFHQPMTTPPHRLPPDLDPLIARALPALQRATGLPVAFGGPVSSVNHALRINQLRGTLTRSLENLLVDAGAGLGGKAVALGRVSTVRNYFSAKGITHEYDRAVAPERLRAMVAIPVRTGLVTRAVLYVATRDQATCGDRVLRAAAEVVSRLERDILVEEEVWRRIAASSTWTAAAPSEAVGELRAELTAIAGSIADGQARARLLAVCERLKPPADLECESAAVTLSAREAQVLAAVSAGCTNDEISAHLDLKPNTVKSYLKNAMCKLDATNRIQAVNKARAAGLLPAATPFLG